jgi:hypothetical protein
MALIYKNAIVIIAADRASDNNKGFLLFRPERVYIKVSDKVNEDINIV